MTTRSRRLVFWIALLGFINALVNTAYATFMVFVVLQPPGGVGPLFTRAITLIASEEGFRLIMLRRAYASEAWQTIFQVFVFAIIMAVSGYRKTDPGVEAKVVHATVS